MTGECSVAVFDCIGRSKEWTTVNHPNWKPEWEKIQCRNMKAYLKSNAFFSQGIKHNDSLEEEVYLKSALQHTEKKWKLTPCTTALHHECYFIVIGISL